MKIGLVCEGGGFKKGLDFSISKKHGIKTQSCALKLFPLGVKADDAI
jgi:hypothetical protein